MNRDEHRRLLLEQLNKVEAEMRRIGYWVSPPPAADSPGFEAWLQTEFLPGARTRIEADDIPEKSMVGVAAMRQYDYHSICEEALPLVSLLHEFDHLVRDIPAKRSTRKKDR